MESQNWEESQTNKVARPTERFPIVFGCLMRTTLQIEKLLNYHSILEHLFLLKKITDIQDLPCQSIFYFPKSKPILNYADHVYFSNKLSHKII